MDSRRIFYEDGDLVDSAHPCVSIKDELAADAAQILAEIGEPVIWNGRLTEPEKNWRSGFGSKTVVHGEGAAKN